MSVGLIVTVGAVEGCFNMFYISREHKGVLVFKEGKDSDGPGKKDTRVIMEIGGEVFGDGFLEVLDNSLFNVEVDF